MFSTPELRVCKCRVGESEMNWTTLLTRCCCCCWGLEDNNILKLVSKPKLISWRISLDELLKYLKHLLNIARDLCKNRQNYKLIVVNSVLVHFYTFPWFCCHIWFFGHVFDLQVSKWILSFLFLCQPSASVWHVVVVVGFVSISDEDNDAVINWRMSTAWKGETLREVQTLSRLVKALLSHRRDAAWVCSNSSVITTTSYDVISTLLCLKASQCTRGQFFLLFATSYELNLNELWSVMKLTFCWLAPISWLQRHKKGRNVNMMQQLINLE